MHQSSSQPLPHRDPDRPGGIATLIVMIVMFLTGTKTAFEAVGLLLEPLGAARALTDYIGAVVVHILEFLTVWLLIVRGDRLSWTVLGFRPLQRQDWLRLIPWSIVTVLCSVLSFWMTSLFWTGGSSKASAVESAGLLLSVLMTAIVAPVVEETAYRGVLYRYLRNRLNTGGSVAVSSFVFGLAHAPSWEVVPNAVVTGAVFALAYERTGTLWFSILLHGILNGSFTLLFFLSNG
ncbi:CPBP family intramembrane glutamic endopeptidase [Paenibacillus ehimensis]|uniref:CPBP family intramembrane metalloprotease n=1 Tax=Paenibacillus ehimensis TaxID=79264 RepID=A0ABT8VJH4_9BACL|nr:CPBP family intramembrane glutamic endopeptidase [Paenibacillus ehimensis]MDO3681146.1 CPBP family intramembrane metalloprotease [Paenibacillus ehimensis]